MFVRFQLFTVGVLIYSVFAAIYYAKYTINDYENYDDYLYGRSARSIKAVPSTQTAFLGLPVETYLRIFNAISNYGNKQEWKKRNFHFISLFNRLFDFFIRGWNDSKAFLRKEKKNYFSLDEFDQILLWFFPRLNTLKQFLKIDKRIQENSDQLFGTFRIPWLSEFSFKVLHC